MRAVPRRATNLLLLLLVTALVATGITGWLIPEVRALPFYDAHRALGLALLALLAWKQLIARASLQRRLSVRHIDASLVVGAVSGIGLVATLAFGIAWTSGLVSFDRPWAYSALNLHVLIGLAVLPLVLLHTLQRWERRPSIATAFGRRSALRLIGIGGLAALLTPALALLPDPRRASGSKHAGSFTGNAFPTTIWAFDEVPGLDAATWRLDVVARGATTRSLSYADLTAMPAREASAVIDCTGGWWSEQRWGGVALRDLLRAAGVDGSRLDGARIDVVSVTGHRWSFAADELDEALVALRVGGERLAPGHGYPARLVVPGRRGLQWVKWLARVEIA